MQHAFTRLALPFSCCQKIVRVLSNVSYNIDVRDHVSKALSNNEPVVALESTIITHGMPFPQNLRTALSVENVIQRKGVTPATIGIIDGKLIVGLNDEEIEYLAQNTHRCIKVSRRDIAYVMSKKGDGGTTVSGTMFAANIAKIPIFVTGGIGGVHRDAQESFDISADLTELGKTSVAVVCAGVKSILDIQLTLEYLETQGVPVVTYGETKDFPSFFSSKSGFQSPYSLKDPFEVANLLYKQKSLQLQNGIVIAVPIPSEYSTDNDEIQAVILKALNEAKNKGVTGKEITPYVLSQVSKLSDGRSLEANVKLIEHNASIGADIAIQYSKILQKAKMSEGRKNQNTSDVIQSSKVRNVTHLEKKRPLIIGSSVLDIKAITEEISNIKEATNPGRLHLSVGGVGRNVAEFLGRCEVDPLLITSLGQDAQGEMIFNEMKKIDMDTSGIHWSREHPTASYNVLTSQQTGELILAVGDMSINDTIIPSSVTSWEEEIRSSAIVVLDGNITEAAINTAIQICQRHKVPVWFEPTCFSKATKPFHIQTNIDFASPNFVELNAIHQAIKGENISDVELGEDLDTATLLQQCIGLSKTCQPSVKNLVVTLGRDGVLLVSSRRARFGEGTNNTTAYLHYPAVPERLSPVDVNNVSGAGDSLAGGILFGFLKDYDKDTCMKAGLLGAYQSLLSSSAISQDIKPSLFSYEAIHKWADFNPRSLMSCCRQQTNWPSLTLTTLC